MLTLVLGASPRKERFSHKAVKSLVRHGFEVIPVGKNKGEIMGLDIRIGYPEIKNVHTVSIYLSSRNQTAEVEEYILGLEPKRIIFNPGTYNEDFEKKAEAKEIKIVKDCTLVMLNNNRY